MFTCPRCATAAAGVGPPAGASGAVPGRQGPAPGASDLLHTGTYTLKTFTSIRCCGGVRARSYQCLEGAVPPDGCDGSAGAAVSHQRNQTVSCRQHALQRRMCNINPRPVVTLLSLLLLLLPAAAAAASGPGPGPGARRRPHRRSGPGGGAGVCAAQAAVHRQPAKAAAARYRTWPAYGLSATDAAVRMALSLATWKPRLDANESVSLSQPHTHRDCAPFSCPQAPLSSLLLTAPRAKGWTHSTSGRRRAGAWSCGSRCGHTRSSRWRFPAASACRSVELRLAVARVWGWIWDGCGLASACSRLVGWGGIAGAYAWHAAAANCAAALLIEAGALHTGNDLQVLVEEDATRG